MKNKTNHDAAQSASSRLFYSAAAIVSSIGCELERTVVLSTQQMSQVFLVLRNSERSFLLAYDIGSRKLRNARKNERAILVSVFKHLISAGCEWFNENMFGSSIAADSSRDHAERMCRSQEETVDCFDIVEEPVEAPMRLYRLSGEPLGYEYALIEETAQASVGWIVVAYEQFSSYRKLSIREECILEFCSSDGKTYSANGAFVRGIFEDERLVVRLWPLPYQLMDNKTFVGLEARGVHPIRLVEYLLKVEDVGFTEVVIDAEMLANEEHLYLVVSFLRGVETDRGCTLGDIRVGVDLETNQVFETAYENSSGPKCLIWTYQRAMSYAEARKAAESRMVDTASLISYVCRQERVMASFGASDRPNQWSMNVNKGSISLGGTFYIEDCDEGGFIVDGGSRSPSEEACCVDGETRSQFEQQWLSPFFPACGRKRHYLVDAVRWLERAKDETSRIDQVISLNTSVEYCINEERGETVGQIAFRDTGVNENIISTEEMMLAIDKALSAKLYETGINDETVAKRISGQIKQSLRSTSFNSRFRCMVDKLGNPISQSEVDLVIRLHKIRNKALHGDEYQQMNTADIQKVSSAIGAIIAAKMRFIVEG